MGLINIETIHPSSESAPTNGFDPVTGLGRTSWNPGAEASFTVKIPEDYCPGSRFSLILEESTPSNGSSHRWTGEAALFRPGVETTVADGPSEAFDKEFESATIPNRLTHRTIDLCESSAPGFIGSVQMAPGQLLYVRLKRESAASNEDPNEIKVFSMVLSYYADSTSVTSNCAGRAGLIIDSVRDLFNEATGGFLSDDFIIRSINRCIEEIAQEDYWRRDTWIPCQSGSTSIDLTAAIPDFQDIHQVKFSGTRVPMTPLAGFQEYLTLSSSSLINGIPENYTVQNNNLLVWPAPNQDSNSGFNLYHSYLPPKVTCSAENPDPPIPKGHDTMLVYYALRQAFLRDRHAPGADSKFIEYSRLFEKERAKLLGEGDSPALYLRSYR